MAGEWIVNVGIANTTDVLWSTWVTGIEQGAAAEAEGLIEAEQARKDGDFEAEGDLWAVSSAKADAVANFDPSDTGSYLFAVALNDGDKPGKGIPRVKRLNGMIPGALIAKAIRETESNPNVKQQDQVFVPFMIKDEGAGA